MAQNAIKSVGLVVKLEQPEADALAIQLAQLVSDEGLQVYCAKENAKVCKALGKNAKAVEKAEMVRHCDLIVVIGGDGTFLGVARLMRDRSVPVMGINMGRLGFLTEIKKEEALKTLKELIQGKKTVRVNERALVEVTLKRDKKTVFQGPVVNDAVISKGEIARIISMEVRIDDQLINTVRADGLIVSTPLGSTAYSLAAGGPIVEPTLPALILTPICAHSLTQRPLLVPDNSEIQIRLKDRPEHVLLTLDGQDVFEMKENDVVMVKRFNKHPLKIISSSTRDYFSLLHEKLSFGMR